MRGVARVGWSGRDLLGERLARAAVPVAEQSAHGQRQGFTSGRLIPVLTGTCGLRSPAAVDLPTYQEVLED